MGTGERSEKIRTYNFPQNRVTDHRIEVTLYNLMTFIGGDMDLMIEQLITYELEQKLAAVKNRALGIKDTPADRERRARVGAAAAKAAIERLGKKSLGRAALRPVLGAIKLRHGLKAIEPFEHGQQWAVRVQTQRDPGSQSATLSMPIVQRETATEITTITFATQQE